MLHETRIQGIPCRVEARYHEARRGGRRDGLQIEPDEPAGWTVDAVYDRTGHPAAWLERKMQDEGVDRIVQELTEAEETTKWTRNRYGYD